MQTYSNEISLQQFIATFNKYKYYFLIAIIAILTAGFIYVKNRPHYWESSIILHSNFNTIYSDDSPKESILENPFKLKLTVTSNEFLNELFRTIDREGYDKNRIKQEYFENLIVRIEENRQVEIKVRMPTKNLSFNILNFILKKIKYSQEVKEFKKDKTAEMQTIMAKSVIELNQNIKDLLKSNKSASAQNLKTLHILSSYFEARAYFAQEQLNKAESLAKSNKAYNEPVESEIKTIPFKPNPIKIIGLIVFWIVLVVNSSIAIIILNSKKKGASFPHLN